MLKKHEKGPSLVYCILIFILGAFTIFSPKFSKPVVRAQVKNEATQEATLEAMNLAMSTMPPIPTPTPTLQQAGYCLNVPVLFYHHIEPMNQAISEGHGAFTVDDKIFDSQMSYLASHGYQSIPAQKLIEALNSRSTLPPKSVVITVDDGYSDFYTWGYPILVKNYLTASLAIPTGLLGNPGYLSWDQLKQVAASGKVFVYNHTWSHASLPSVEQSKAEYEIRTAKQQLQDKLGLSDNVFFYPYGNSSSNIVSLLKKEGYIGAFSTIGGTMQCEGNIMTLHRTRVGNQSLSSYGL